MRDNWLSNRVFKSYDDILDHCCYAWNRPIEQPWRIMSIRLSKWAYRFWLKRIGMRTNIAPGAAGTLEQASGERDGDLTAYGSD